MITMIVATDINYGIGNKKGELLFNLPNDMAHFKSVTSGKHVVMGRKTWDSLPLKPLPKRKNYVLTHDENFEVKGKTQVLHSIDEVLELAKKREIFIIGGGEIYKQFMPYADRLIMTHVHTIDLEARVFFPDFNIHEWTMSRAKKNEIDDKHKYSFTITTYDKRKKEKE